MPVDVVQHHLSVAGQVGAVAVAGGVLQETGWAEYVVGSVRLDAP